MISPLGLVPKKTPSEFCLIHHLSFPCGSSVNDGIPRALCSINYASTADAIKLVKQLGPGCYMAKTDIASAFRIIPIHPCDFHLLGMKWQGKYYFDRCLPMGCSTSCSIFESFSTALDSITMQASLPEDKLARCRDQLLSCYRMKRITLRDLQSLIGLLNFTCSVIVPGCAFLRRLINLTKGI